MQHKNGKWQFTCAKCHPMSLQPSLLCIVCIFISHWTLIFLFLSEEIFHLREKKMWFDFFGFYSKSTHHGPAVSLSCGVRVSSSFIGDPWVNLSWNFSSLWDCCLLTYSPFPFSLYWRIKNIYKNQIVAVHLCELL